jgi:hypothetical protein
MCLAEQAAARKQRSHWTVGLCLFLVALFLYNPFLTIPGSSPVVKVQHPPSFRATVASSELRRSRVTQAQPQIQAPEEAVLEGVAHFTLAIVSIGVPQQESLDFQPRTFSKSLWFRPPPVS